MTVVTTTGLDVPTLSLGLLITRLTLGLAMAAHGAQKLFGWFGGPGLTGAGTFLESLGFRPGRTFAAANSLSEFTGGLLVALGLLGPVGPALMIAQMLVAVLTVHRAKGFFATGNGIEVPVLYAAGAMALAFTGFGVFSLDSVLGLGRVESPTLEVLTVALGVLGGLAALALRKPGTNTAAAGG